MADVNDQELNTIAIQGTVSELENQRNLLGSRCSQLASERDQYKLLFEREKKKVIDLTESLAEASGSTKSSY